MVETLHCKDEQGTDDVPIWGPDRTPIDNLGYIVLSATMIAAALIELIWGVAAERRPLEDVARPLTFVK